MKYFTSLAKYYDMQFHRAYPGEAEFIEGVLNRHSPRKPARVLDLMCGTGGHAIILARRGFGMTGADNSPEMVRICREKAAKESLAAEFHVMDARNLEFEKAFDGAYCWFNSFQYLLTDEDAAAALAGVRNALVEKGVFLIDLRNGFAALREMKERLPVTMCHEMGGVRFRNTTHDIRLDMANRTATFSQDYVIEDGENVLRESERHTYRVYRYPEFRSLLEANGFAVAEVYGEPDMGKRYTDAGRKMIFAAVKE